MICFECKRPHEKGFSIGSHLICWFCVRSILEQHIKDVQDREAHIDEKSEDLATRLGYKKGVE